MLVTPLRKFGWRNIEDLRAGVDEKLGRKCTLTEFFGDLWLATKSDAVYGATSAAAVGTDPRATSKRRGREFDFINEYNKIVI